MWHGRSQRSWAGPAHSGGWTPGMPLDPLFGTGAYGVKSGLEELGEVALSGIPRHGTAPSLNLGSAMLWGSTSGSVVDNVLGVVTVESPFCGREGQMAVVRELLDGASTGVGSVVLVEADAGLG